MHTQASNQYQELRVDNGLQQIWLTMVLVSELNKRYPNARNHAKMIAKAVYNMQLAAPLR